jgi:outer membrane murein-binding lipoprotein Lpp
MEKGRIVDRVIARHLGEAPTEVNKYSDLKQAAALKLFGKKGSRDIKPLPLKDQVDSLEGQVLQLNAKVAALEERLKDSGKQDIDVMDMKENVDLMWEEWENKVETKVTDKYAARIAALEAQVKALQGA